MWRNSNLCESIVTLLCSCTVLGVWQQWWMTAVVADAAARWWRCRLCTHDENRHLLQFVRFIRLLIESMCPEVGDVMMKLSLVESTGLIFVHSTTHSPFPKSPIRLVSNPPTIWCPFLGLAGYFSLSLVWLEIESMVKMVTIPSVFFSKKLPFKRNHVLKWSDLLGKRVV